MRLIGFLIVFAEALFGIAIVSALTQIAVSLGVILGGAFVVGVISDAVYLYTMER